MRYRILVKRVLWVYVDGCETPGTVVAGSTYVHVLRDGERHIRRYHPSDVDVSGVAP